MKIVIDIPDDDYEYIKLLHESLTNYQITLKLYRAVKNGTILPNDCGDLIDKQKVYSRLGEEYSDRYVDMWNSAISTCLKIVDNTQSVIPADKGEE